MGKVTAELGGLCRSSACDFLAASARSISVAHSHISE